MTLEEALVVKVSSSTKSLARMVILFGSGATNMGFVFCASGGTGCCFG